AAAHAGGRGPAELPVRGRPQRRGPRPAARGEGREAAPGRGLARAPGPEREGVRAVSDTAPRSHGPAGEGGSLLKPLVAKRRAADHDAAPAPMPALGRAAAGPSEETSMT